MSYRLRQKIAQIHTYVKKNICGFNLTDTFTVLKEVDYCYKLIKFDRVTFF